MLSAVAGALPFRFAINALAQKVRGTLAKTRPHSKPGQPLRKFSTQRLKENRKPQSTSAGSAPSVLPSRLCVNVSKDWKWKLENFQALENLVEIFPRLGKNPTKFSRAWNNKRKHSDDI
jgi:hypothetical protein